jgi:hypothetical protein
VLATDYLLMCLLHLWCHIVAEAVSGGWVAYMLDRMEALSSVPVSEECQLPAEALLALLFLCQCIVFLLRPGGPLLAFW